MKICISEGCVGIVHNSVKHSRCKDCKRLLEKYKITSPERDAMYAEQKGKCLVCDDKIYLLTTLGYDFKHRACVDHCHATGDVRGLLCQSCNGGLGLFRDNTDRLKSAIAYLEGN